jgi:hypothetical protein
MASSHLRYGCGGLVALSTLIAASWMQLFFSKSKWQLYDLDPGIVSIQKRMISLSSADPIDWVPYPNGRFFISISNAILRPIAHDTGIARL